MTLSEAGGKTYEGGFGNLVQRGKWGFKGIFEASPKTNKCYLFLMTHNFDRTDLKMLYYKINEALDVGWERSAFVHIYWLS